MSTLVERVLKQNKKKIIMFHQVDQLMQIKLKPGYIWREQVQTRSRFSFWNTISEKGTAALPLRHEFKKKKPCCCVYWSLSYLLIFCTTSSSFADTPFDPGVVIVRASKGITWLSSDVLIIDDGNSINSNEISIMKRGASLNTLSIHSSRCK